MNPGDFNRRLLLQTISTATDGAGGTVLTGWEDELEFMALVEPFDMSRRVNYNQIITEPWTHRITTYFMGIVNMPGIRMRVVLEDGTICNVNSVVNKNYKNQFIELMCYADPDAPKWTFPIEDGSSFVEDFEQEDVHSDDGSR